MANVYEGWKGAVEPAEASASGNEYQAWKGAAEPVAAAAGVTARVRGGPSRAPGPPGLLNHVSLLNIRTILRR